MESVFNFLVLGLTCFHDIHAFAFSTFSKIFTLQLVSSDVAQPAASKMR